MKDIDSSAAMAVVYLGDAWDNFCTELCILILIEPDHAAHFDRLLEPHVAIGGRAPLEFEAFVDIIYRFTALPWFRQLWTVQ